VRRIERPQGRHFIQFSRAWYASANLPLANGVVDELAIGDEAGEFRVSWYELNGLLAPRLEVFDDGWRVLASMPDFLSLLYRLDDQNIGPTELCTELEALGFTNATPLEP
jgi:hypothetical protein